MKRKQKTLSVKRKSKSTARYLDGGGDSKYARKHKYCVRHGIWGFEIFEPKPWQKAIN